MQQPDRKALGLKAYLNSTSAVVVVVLASLFLLVNLTIIICGGVRLGGDSERYLGGADNLLRGIPLQGRQISYSGYALLIAFCRLTGAGMPGVIFVQLVFAALAAIALYDLGRRLHGHRAGLIAAGLFSVNPDIARWNAFILTDSLYISLVILSVWAIHTAALRRRHWYIIAACTLAAAALIRPNGLFLLAVAVLYLVSRAVSHKTLRWLAISSIILAFILGAIIASRFYSASSEDHPEATLRKGITGIHPWRVPMPSDPAPIEGEWSAAFSYAAKHPLASLRLGITRAGIELIHVRPFYSFRHNIALLATLPLLYLLALTGLKLNRDPSLMRLVLLVITTHLFVVAITFADTDGRFLLYVLPLICLFSACALAHLIDRLALSGELPTSRRLRPSSFH
ncbi:MAG TPA: glycosyltransferase family 39 protein [Pyrinomonadaceae bacterium]|jgi:4-amino-4-deoxy-L-arabinose transferase-like glycosyltransferase